MYLSFLLTPQHPPVSHLNLFQIYRLHTEHFILYCWILLFKTGQLGRLKFLQFFYITHVRSSCCSLCLFCLFKWEGSCSSSYFGQIGSRHLLSEWVTVLSLLYGACLLISYFLIFLNLNGRSVVLLKHNALCLWKEHQSHTHRNCKNNLGQRGSCKG